MGTVHALPTAAPKRVRQRAFHSVPCGVRRELREAGKLVRLPFDHWQHPEVRKALAERAARQETYDAGGLTRSAAYFLLSAITLALTPEQKRAVRRMTETLETAYPDDAAARAAALWAREVLSAGDDQ